MAHPAGSETGTGMVVGRPSAVPDPPAAPADGRHRPGRGSGPTRDADTRGTSWRWVVVIAVLAVAAVGAVVLGRSPDRPRVQVVDPWNDEWVSTTAAPSGPISRRWSHVLPSDHELVGMAVVGTHVVVASRARRTSADDPGVVVEALDTLDGERGWRRQVAGRDTIVLLVDESSTTLASTVGLDADPTGRFAWGGDVLVTLDPRDGSVRWRRDLGRDGYVHVRPDGDVVVEDADEVALVDPVEGTDRLNWPTLAEPEDGAGWERRAWWSGDAWVVPTDGGWEIADSTGRIEFGLDDPERWPVVTDELVVTHDGSVVRGLRRPDGAVAWTVDVGREVAWVDPDTGDRDATRVIAHVEPEPGTDWDAEDGPVEDMVVITDGVVVPDAASEADIAGVPSEWVRMQVDVEGALRELCRRPPPGWGSDDTATDCPGDLALLEPGGEPVATAEAEQVADHDPSATWRGTDRGLLTVEPGRVRLLRWEDLSEAWTIGLPRDHSQVPTIDTNAAGVAVAVPLEDPPRVDWHG